MWVGRLIPQGVASPPLNKVIWTCWFQGRDEAPLVVRRCLDSWEQKNPEWEFRCLDSVSALTYTDLDLHIDLDSQTITAASLSDLLRLLLLHEYGGVWVDATVLCNRPLDEWLPDVSQEGFFAFAKPGPGRPISSWFLASRTENELMSRWTTESLEYWRDRTSTDDYFWLHRAFGRLCDTDERAAAAWERIPKVSARGPHAIQAAGFYRPASEVVESIDWTLPVFKLTYRVDDERFVPGCLLDHVLQRTEASHGEVELGQRNLPSRIGSGLSKRSDSRGQTRRDRTITELPPRQPMDFAALKVSTNNLGDHVQVLAGQRLMDRLGVQPRFFVDRDDEIATADQIVGRSEPVGILLNGWFKWNGEAWPPHPLLLPLFLGFHIRLGRCPELISPEAVDYYRRYGPIGCRDTYTQSLLADLGVDSFVSRCLSLTFMRRTPNTRQQRDVFVVSRDERLLDLLPESLGQFEFVSHYSDSTDFDENMDAARSLLNMYRTRARFIVTTLLHCALPALAMGIPVVVFYPINSETGHESDLERFTALDGLVRVYHPSEIDEVDWDPEPVDVSAIKLHVLDSLLQMSSRWRLPGPRKLDPIAPPAALPPPDMHA